MTDTKWVYTFGDGKAEGQADMKNLLGGKGANLAEMSNLGLPVPPGFTVTTEVCTYYYDHDETYPDELKVQAQAALDEISAIAGAEFGGAENPFLVSVRSGARASMPGMMDTVLNLGLNDVTVEGLADKSGDRRFAYDSYRRFIQMYGDVVLGVSHDHFEEILEDYKDQQGHLLDTDLNADEWAGIIKQYKNVIERELGKPFPQDVAEQLWGALSAVFGSWMNRRAETYRRLHDIPASWGTAVNIQAMVFGNMGDTCATGVAFHPRPIDRREPASTANTWSTPRAKTWWPASARRRILPKSRASTPCPTCPAWKKLMPETFAELWRNIRNCLETHYRDMQDIEFTVQRRQALHAANPFGQAHHQGGLAHRGGNGSTKD